MKSAIVILLALLMVLSLAACGGGKAAAEAAAKNAAEQYMADFKLASETMLSGAATAETWGNLTHDVWYDAINKEDHPSTEKYVLEHRSNGSTWRRDFNDALGQLFSDLDYMLAMKSLEDNQESVLGLMKKLTSPPDEYKTAYTAITDLYNSYTEFTDLVINPSGSLSSFTSSYNDAHTNLLKYYKAVQIYIDD